MSNDRYWRCGQCWNLFPANEQHYAVIDLLIERRFVINRENRFWDLSSESKEWCCLCMERLKAIHPEAKGATA